MSLILCLKTLGKSVDDIDLEKFVINLSKQADNSPNGIVKLNPENLSSEQKKMGLVDKHITNKTAQEVAEDIGKQKGLGKIIGTKGIKKLASKLKNKIIKPADIAAYWTLPLYGWLKNLFKGGAKKFINSRIFL